MVSDAIHSLNEMYFGSSDFVLDGALPSLAQRTALAEIEKCARRMGPPPPGLTGQGALRALLSKQGYASEPATLAPLDVHLLSLPPADRRPVSLQQLLGDASQEILERLHNNMVPMETGRQQARELGLARPYLDPGLRRHHKQHVQFVRLLHQRGLVEFRRSARVVIGAFAVWKKNQKQRLILDARASNCHWGRSPPVRLATGHAFSSLEVDAGPGVWLGGVDIADAFYAIELPQDFRDLFALKNLKAGLVDIKQCVDGPVRAQDMIYPCFKAVPMGWSQALWICQEVHERIAARVAAVRPDNRFIDALPTQKIDEGLIHTEYVDNFVGLSKNEQEVRAVTEQVAAALQAAGLPTHPVEVSQGGDTLGWRFDEEAPTLGVNPLTAWRIKMAFEEISQRDWIQGDHLEVLIGHFTVRALLRRELLSCLGACYAFCRQHRGRLGRVWCSVHRELKWVASLIMMAFRDMAAPWDEELLAVDASHWGVGVVSRSIPSEQARELGRYSERWRFSRQEEQWLAPRTSALDQQIRMIVPAESEKASNFVRQSVPEVPADLWVAHGFVLVLILGGEGKLKLFLKDVLLFGLSNTNFGGTAALGLGMWFLGTLWVLSWQSPKVAHRHPACCVSLGK